MRFSAILAVGVFAATASAQLTNVLPSSADGVAGSSVNAFPWGTSAAGWPGLRIQTIYDSTHFTAAATPVNFPILITSVKWRANDDSTTWTGGTYSNATLALATAAVDHTAATTAWASNVGPDYTVVHNGPVTVLPGTGAGVGVPGPYVVDIPVVPPFFYDPSLGDLVVDTDFVTGAFTGGSLVGMDVQPTNVLARRVYSSSLYPNANGVDQAAPVIEIGFQPAGGGTVATNTTLGIGCINQPDVSSYENFAAATAFDLANTGISMLNTGGGYTAIPGITTFVPPSATATVLTLTDDSEATVTLSQAMPVGASGSTNTLTVCSNGFVSSGSGNGTGFTPTAATFLNGPRAFWSIYWHDLNPAIAGSGQVKFEQIGSIAYITWDGVWDFGGTSTANANTFQAQFDVTSGTVHYVYGAMSGLGNGALTGFSDAGASADPGSMDISAALPSTYTAASFGIVPLTLTAASRPKTGTNWNLNVTNVPAAGVLGVDVFGLVDPGINDLAFLGAPGCGLRASLDVVNAWIVAGNSHSYTFAVPNNPALVNVHVFTTSAVFANPPVNAFGAITANGIDGRVGDV